MTSIRPITSCDLHSVQQLASDPAIAATTNLPSPYPQNGATEWFARISTGIAEGRQVVFVVTDNGECIGVMSLNDIDRGNAQCSLDYWIGKPHWGRGHATRAASLAVTYARCILGLSRITSGCLETNLGSKRVLEKSGFIFLSESDYQGPCRDRFGSSKMLHCALDLNENSPQQGARADAYHSARMFAGQEPIFERTLDTDLKLRMLRQDDAEQLFRVVHANREHLRQWLPWLDDNTEIEHTRKFISSTRDQHARHEGFVCAIWLSGCIVGVIGFNSIRWSNRSAEIGYWLSRKAIGKGTMTRCCRVLIDHAFTELGLNRITIPAAVGNSRSRAIPERLRFRQEGIIRDAEWLYDHYVDHVLYAALKGEWDSEQGCCS